MISTSVRFIFRGDMCLDLIFDAISKVYGIEVVQNIDEPNVMLIVGDERNEQEESKSA